MADQPDRLLDAAEQILVIAQVERLLEIEVREQNEMSKTPKLASLTKAYDQLITSVERDAEKAHNLIAGTDARRGVVMANVTANIDAVKVGLDDINSAFDSLMGDNGPPTSEGSDLRSDAAENPQKPQS